MRINALVIVGVLGLASGSEALAQYESGYALPLPMGDNVYRDSDYRRGASSEGLYKPDSPRSRWTAVADLRKRTRNAFERAQGQKAKGDTAEACKSIRTAIELDRRYIERRNSYYPGNQIWTDESYYQGIEAEYCETERG